MLCHGKLVPPKLSLVSRVPDESTPQVSEKLLSDIALQTSLWPEYGAIGPLRRHSALRQGAVHGDAAAVRPAHLTKAKADTAEEIFTASYAIPSLHQ